MYTSIPRASDSRYAEVARFNKFMQKDLVHSGEVRSIMLKTKQAPLSCPFEIYKKLVKYIHQAQQQNEMQETGVHT